MTTIWKYPIPPTDTFEHTMPRGARVIHVGLDPNEQPCF